MGVLWVSWVSWVFPTFSPADLLHFLWFLRELLTGELELFHQFRGFECLTQKTFMFLVDYSWFHNWHVPSQHQRNHSTLPQTANLNVQQTNIKIQNLYFNVCLSYTSLYEIMWWYPLTTIRPHGVNTISKHFVLDFMFLYLIIGPSLILRISAPWWGLQLMSMLTADSCLVTNPFCHLEIHLGLTGLTFTASQLENYAAWY